MENEEKKPVRFKRKSKNDFNEIFVEFGKIPPQDTAIEENVLGIIIDGKCNFAIFRIFKMEVFYKTEHQLIAQAIIDLYTANKPIDLLIVCEQLRLNGTLEQAGGRYYVSQLLMKATRPDHIEYQYKILQQKFMLREIIRIGSTAIKDAYQDTTDVFDLIESIQHSFNAIDERDRERFAIDNTTVHQQVFNMINKKQVTGVPMLFYQTPWKEFNEKVVIGSNKIILLAGAAKDGKTKFLTMLIMYLLENYKDIAVDWVTLEDAALDIWTHYLSSKVFIKGKDIKKNTFSADVLPIINKHVTTLQGFDINFIEKSLTIEKIRLHFKLFCDKRPEKFKILVIDNILQLGDRERYQHDLNGMYDYVMSQISNIRQETNALILVVHHFNDAQQNKENIANGYRPRLTDIKGTEAFRRVPNQVLLINSPGKRKDLLSDYKGDRKENLKKIFIVDVGASREDDNIDVGEGVIHFLCSLDYNIFREIDYYDPQQGTKGQKVTFDQADIIEPDPNEGPLSEPDEEPSF